MNIKFKSKLYLVKSKLYLFKLYIVLRRESFLLWIKKLCNKVFTKFIVKERILVKVYVPTIVRFVDGNNIDPNIDDKTKYGKFGREKAIAIANAAFERENNPELFKAFDTIKKHRLDVVFFIDKNLF